MFSAGHAPLLVLLIWLVTTSYGQRDQLTSKLVSSCGTNGLDVTNFGITYHRASRVLEYRLIAAAQRPGLSADIHVDVTAYGIQAPTQIIDLCAVATCPLSQSSINVEGSQVLAASYADKLPAIAWTIPDLDAIATFTFGDNATQLACLKASLSNGVTTQTTSVPWVTGVTTIVAIAVAGVISAAGGLGLTATGTGTGTTSGPNVLSPAAPSALTPAAPSMSAPADPSVLAPAVPSALTPAAPSALTPTAPSALSATVPPPGSTAGVTGGDIAMGLAIPVATAGAGAGTLATTAGTTSGTAAQPHATTQAQSQSSSGDHGPPAGRMDPIVLFLHFQSISSTGLLSLRYPPIYQAFTVNFAWANFILPIGAFKSAATHLRKCDLPDGQTAANGNGVASLAVPSVSSGPLLAEQTGIQAYATRIGVPAQDLFGIVYFVYLCACAVLIALFFLVGLVMQVGVWTAKTPERKVIWMARRTRWGEMASNNTLRIMMLALGALATFSFYQWTQSCTSRLAAFLSASALIIILTNLGIVTFFILRLAARPGGSAWLFSNDTSYGRRWGTLYNTLSETTVYFVAPFLVFVIARSAITWVLHIYLGRANWFSKLLRNSGFGQGHGLAQVIAMLAVELIMAVSLFYWQPYYSKGYNRVNYLLEMGKVISHIFLLLFVPSFKINLIATTVIGIVLLVVNSVIALVLLVLTVLKLGWGILWFRNKHHAFDVKDGKRKRPLTTESYESHDDGKFDESGLPRPQHTYISTT